MSGRCDASATARSSEHDICLLWCDSVIAWWWWWLPAAGGTAGPAGGGCRCCCLLLLPGGTDASSACLPLAMEMEAEEQCAPPPAKAPRTAGGGHTARRRAALPNPSSLAGLRDRDPSAWAASVGGRTGRRYVPVGAVLTLAPLTQPVRQSLEAAGWLKKLMRFRIHPYTGPERVVDVSAAVDGGGPEDAKPASLPPQPRRMVLHVCPIGAAALDAASVVIDGDGGDGDGGDGDGGRWADHLPPQLSELAALLQSGQARWLSGLRLGDPPDEGGLGEHWHLVSADLKRAAAQARQKQQQRQQEEEGKAAAAAATSAAAAAAAGGGDRPASRGRHRFRFVELFAGIGGFRVALESLGGECVFASEVGEEERQTYFQNYGEYPASDITETPAALVPQHTLLTAGFPCQSFCKAGLKTGFNDARGELFFEVTRVVRRSRPLALLLENVPNLVQIDQGAALRTILEELHDLGYASRHTVGGDHRRMSDDVAHRLR
jgi:hypothetical protein